MKWRQFHRDAFERWEKRGGKNYSLIGDQLERIFMGGGINIVIVYYINTRGKLHTGKWCRVKEAGNRLTPGGHSNNSYVRVEFRGGGGDRRSLEVLSSKVASKPTLRIRPLAAPLSGFSRLKELLLFCQRHYLISSIRCPLIYLPFFVSLSPSSLSANSMEPDLN